MTQTLPLADAVLKENYQGPVVDLLNNSSPTLAQFEQTSQHVEGRRAVIPLHVRRSSGVGSRGEMETLPEPDRQKFVNAHAVMRYHYAAIEVSGPAIKHMSSDAGTFVQEAEDELERIVTDLRRDLSRQVWGTSDGVIAQCGTTSASTTLQLASDTTDTEILQAYADGGMKLDIGTVADPDAVASNVAVNGYDLANKTLELASSVTTTGSHFIFRHGNGGASDGSGMPGDGQREFTGLRTIVSAGDLQGVSATTYPVWKANVFSNGGNDRAFTERLLTSAMQQASRRSGRVASMICTSTGVLNSIAEELGSIGRNAEVMTIKGGYKAVRWGYLPLGQTQGEEQFITADLDVPENTIFGIDIGEMGVKVHQTADWGWMDLDGSIFRKVPGKGPRAEDRAGAEDVRQP